MAAGESTRMGRDKALLPWPKEASDTETTGALARPGGTLLSSAIRAFSDHCDLVIVVVGKNEPALAPIIYGEGAFLIRNPEPERGQLSSLQTGLQDVLDRGRDSAMVTLVDRPPPLPETLETLTKALSGRAHGIWAVVPSFEGKHGHPFVIGREMIEVFLNTPPTGTAREVEHRHQSRILYIEVPDAMVSANINSLADYSSL